PGAGHRQEDRGRAPRAHPLREQGRRRHHLPPGAAIGAAGVTTRRVIVGVVAVAALAGGCKGRAPATSGPPGAARPADAASLCAAGRAALADKRLREAVDDFTGATAMASDPDLRANAWLGLGAAYAELGDDAHAIAAYEQVTVLRPDDADAWRVLAEGLAA